MFGSNLKLRATSYVKLNQIFPSGTLMLHYKNLFINSLASIQFLIFQKKNMHDKSFTNYQNHQITRSYSFLLYVFQKYSQQNIMQVNLEVFKNYD